MGDLSYAIAWEIAGRMGPPPVPSWLSDADSCIQVVELVQAKVVPAWVNLGPMTRKVWEPILDAAFDAWSENSASCPGVTNQPERKNIILRLWSGCAGTGKAIDRRTMSGSTSEVSRRQSFADIDGCAASCPIFRAGVQYAVDWKEHLGQLSDVVLDGIDDPLHPVRVRYEAKRR
jgi:hypothetical protein